MVRTLNFLYSLISLPVYEGKIKCSNNIFPAVSLHSESSHSGEISILMNFKLIDVIIIDNPEIRVLNQKFRTRKKYYSEISLNANNQEIKVNNCSGDIRVLDFNAYSIYSGRLEPPRESLNNQSYIQASIVSTKNQF
ncbi:hypothetical protein cand_016320 [Cryptosporidium andersoni]|uniref:Uncharacterized protein n=1 Tax=Cryptosporidium andersoni TaxID=117008 RepID=A0A1J4MTG1_9CRYT|nr:hypothetical protein cand_016320 [Cryptosporidium andersoni]